MENDDRCLDSASLCNRGGNPNPILGDGALQRGDRRKEDVKKLQRMLKELDYDLGNTGPEKDGVDGSFGKKTHDAVIEFQQDEAHKYWEGKTLNDDGLVGPRTSDALNREMVGVWYDFYQTDEKITEGKKIITVTSNYLSDTGLSLEDLKPEEDIDVIIKGEIQKIKYGIDLTATDLYWLPDARNDRLDYTARIYGFLKDKWVFPPPRKRTITFQLNDVSKETGVCMNYPKKDKSNNNPDLFFPDDGDNSKVFDFEDDDTSGEACPTEIVKPNDNPAHKFHYQKATTKEAVTEAKIIVRCEDFGAFGTLQASAPNCETLSPREKNDPPSQKTGPNDVKIPYDENGNNIADCALQDDGGKPANTDEDDVPHSDHPGDGLTNYEEYRGFIVKRGSSNRHIRTNIKKKDIFIYDKDGIGTGYFSKSGLQIHIIPGPDFYNGNSSNKDAAPDAGTQIINFNRGNDADLTGGDQHALRLVNENMTGLLGYSYGDGPGNPAVSNRVAVNVAAHAGTRFSLSNTIAHELGHAIDLWHHGREEEHEHGNPKRTSELVGGVTSGNVSCIMRYDNYHTRWCHHTGASWCRHRIPGNETPGNIFCNSPNGTGCNAIRNHFSNDASANRGNCKSHIKVKDW